MPITGPAGALTGLDASQRTAAVHDADALAVLAPAGSGKTRVLTRRIAHRIGVGHAGASHVLALTFTRKAATELATRLRALDVPGSVTAGTFHAIALAQLRRHLADSGRAMPAVLDRKGRILFSLVGGRGARAALAVQEVAAEIEWAKARLVTPGRFGEAVAAAERATSRPVGELSGIYERYEEEKRRRGLVDFEDLLWWCAAEIESNEAFAAQQRHRFRHFFVDEFQDVNAAQWRLLKAWLGDRRDVTVVGDDAQAIYGFSGADARYLRGFDGLVPGAATLRLACNYRSSPQIVAAADALLGPLARVERPRPEAKGEPGSAPHFSRYDDEHAEAAGVARDLVRANRRGVPFGAMAVLYRTNAQSAAFEQALADAGVPYRLSGSARFVDRVEVRALLDELAAAERSAKARPLGDHLVDIEAVAQGDEAEASAERRAHAATLAALGRDYLVAEGDPGSVSGFVAWLRATTQGDEGPRADTVDLMTFHRAKGLEWHSVWCTGLERGLVPISHARSSAAQAEERRLLHVALSRAERELHLSLAARRTFGNRLARRDPSPYVESILAANAPGPHDRIGDPKAELQRVRAAIGGSSPRTEADGALLTALKAWRRAEAAAHAIPAFTVFHDSTLRGIVAVRPRSRDELLAVAGVGPAKLERYGESVLELVTRHGAAAPAGPS